MDFQLTEKAQGSLEYLLLLGGAILVAAVVAFVLFNSTQPAKNKVSSATNTLFNTLNIK